MVDPIIIGAGIEVVRMAMQLYLVLAAQAGMTEDEIMTMLVTEREKFLMNRPELLPKPPEEV